MMITTKMLDMWKSKCLSEYPVSVTECLWYHVTMEVKECHAMVERIRSPTHHSLSLKGITVQDVDVSTCQQSVLTSSTSALHLGFEFQYEH